MYDNADELDDDYDYNYDFDDLDDNDLDLPGSMGKENKKDKKDKPKKNVILDTRPRMKQVEGKVVRLPNNATDLGLQTESKLYQIDMDAIGQSLRKELYNEILANGFERQEGKIWFFKVHNYL